MHKSLWRQKWGAVYCSKEWKLWEGVWCTEHPLATVTLAAGHNLHTTLILNESCLLRQMKSLRGGLMCRTSSCDANRCGGSWSACHAGIKYIHESSDDEQWEKPSAAADGLWECLMRRTSLCNANRCSGSQSACHAGNKCMHGNSWGRRMRDGVCCGRWTLRGCWCTGHPFTMLTTAVHYNERCSLLRQMGLWEGPEVQDIPLQYQPPMSQFCMPTPAYPAYKLSTHPCMLDDRLRCW